MCPPVSRLGRPDGTVSYRQTQTQLLCSRFILHSKCICYDFRMAILQLALNKPIELNLQLNLQDSGVECPVLMKAGNCFN